MIPNAITITGSLRVNGKTLMRINAWARSVSSCANRPLERRSGGVPELPAAGCLVTVHEGTTARVTRDMRYASSHKGTAAVEVCRSAQHITQLLVLSCGVRRACVHAFRSSDYAGWFHAHGRVVLIRLFNVRRERWLCDGPESILIIAIMPLSRDGARARAHPSDRATQSGTRDAGLTRARASDVHPW